MDKTGIPPLFHFFWTDGQMDGQHNIHTPHSVVAVKYHTEDLQTAEIFHSMLIYLRTTHGPLHIN